MVISRSECYYAQRREKKTYETCASNANKRERKSEKDIDLSTWWHEGYVKKGESHSNMLKQHLYHHIYRNLIWLSVCNGAIEISFRCKTSFELKLNVKKTAGPPIEGKAYRKKVRRRQKTNSFVDLCALKFHCIPNGIITYHSGVPKLERHPMCSDGHHCKHIAQSFVMSDVDDSTT